MKICLEIDKSINNLNREFLDIGKAINDFYREFHPMSFRFFSFYTKYTICYPSNILPSNNFLHWFIGFIEARGSFIVKNRGELVFIITQSRKNINILYCIREILGFGKVIIQSAGVSRYGYIVQNKKEIEVLISLFNGNIILPTKQEQLRYFIIGFNS
jgi:LAGLIDADG endonuclease